MMSFGFGMRPHKPQSKKGSQVKRLTSQQQKRRDLLSYSIMIIFVLSNVVLETAVASVSKWNLGADSAAGLLDLQMTSCGMMSTRVVFGWCKDNNCGSEESTDNVFEDDVHFPKFDNGFKDKDGNVLPLAAPPVLIRKGCAVQVGHWDPTTTDNFHAVVPGTAPCKFIMILPLRTLIFDKSTGVRWRPPIHPV